MQKLNGVELSKFGLFGFGSIARFKFWLNLSMFSVHSSHHSVFGKKQLKFGKNLLFLGSQMCWKKNKYQTHQEYSQQKNSSCGYILFRETISQFYIWKEWKFPMKCNLQLPVFQCTLHLIIYQCQTGFPLEDVLLW